MFYQQQCIPNPMQIYHVASEIQFLMSSLPYYLPCPLYFFLYNFDVLILDVLVLACTPGLLTFAVGLNVAVCVFVLAAIVLK
jgi:hypothetical protein